MLLSLLATLQILTVTSSSSITEFDANVNNAIHKLEASVPVWKQVAIKDIAISFPQGNAVATIIYEVVDKKPKS